MVEVKPDLVKRLAELIDGDGWQVADLLVEEFPPEVFGDGSSKKNSGLHQALEVYEDALRKQYGVVLRASTMRNYRSTAISWPHATRVACASFRAHGRLRGKEGRELMERYVRRNDGRPLSDRDVARFRADDNPKPSKPWEQRANQRLRSTVKSLLLGGVTTKRDDWWNAHGVAASRDAVVQMLRDLADQMDGRP